MNKLQNGVTLLVFKIYKIRNIHFVGNLILNTSCEFYYDDVTVTLFRNIKNVDVAVKNSALLFQLGMEVLTHPTYSPDLAPSD